MTSPHVALQTLEDARDSGALAALCDRCDLDLLVVHGSVLDPEPIKPVEDLDVAVLFARGADANLLELITELTRLLHIDALDVMELNRAGVVARAEALGKGLPLYERRANLFTNRQTAALTERMETAWMRRLDLELLAR